MRTCSASDLGNVQVYVAVAGAVIMGLVVLQAFRRRHAVRLWGLAALLYACWFVMIPIAFD